MSRRIGATILGGLGAICLTLGLVVFSIFGFVSSATTTRSSVQSLMSVSEIRQIVADEVVTAIEESGDTPQEKVVFSLARPLIENAVSKAIDSARLQEFFGEVSYKAYEVFVDEQPATTVDVAPVIDVAVDAIKQIDSRIAKNFTPKIDPLELKRNVDSPDLKSIRDDVRTGMWVAIVLGLVLEVAAWFLAIADNSVKLRRLGIRVATIGVAMVVATIIARRVASHSSAENKDIIDAVTRFVTSPVYVRGCGLTVVGVIFGIAGWFMTRRTRHGAESAPGVMAS